MVQLLGIIGILYCGQVVYSENVHHVPANMSQAREICEANGLVLPTTSDDNMQIAQRLQKENISATWIDLTISPSPWNWITDDEYTVHYDQGCYNFSSLQVARDSVTDINTCRESCDGYLYVGVQANSTDLIRCVYTNETDVASAVSEHNCSPECYGISGRQFCGNSKLDTFRLLSSLLTKEVTSWKDNPELDFSSSFLCASLSIRGRNISFVPKDCTTKLPAICESDNGTVTRLHNVSWFGARQLCRDQGMKSVRVSLSNQINILMPNFQEGWTALRGWTWRLQGREICDTVPSNWSANYPQKSEGECIVVLKDGSWKNVHCEANKPFICERLLNTSSLSECMSSIPTASCKTTVTVNTKPDQLASSTSETYTATTSELYKDAASEPHTAATSEIHTAATSEPNRAATSETRAVATSEPHRDTSSDPHINIYAYPQSFISSLTEVTHTTSSTDRISKGEGHSSDATIGRGMIGVAVGAVMAFLVLAAVAVIVIVFLRKRKQASSGGLSPRTQRDPGDDKSLRPECDQSMDELPIYASPNRDPPTDGIILVVENSLYGSVDLDDDELQSSRRVTPASANARWQGQAVYELATASIGDEVNDDSTSGQEAVDLSGSNSSMEDQIPDDNPLMIDNSLYDSTDSAWNVLPVP